MVKIKPDELVIYDDTTFGCCIEFIGKIFGNKNKASRTFFPIQLYKIYENDKNYSYRPDLSWTKERIENLFNDVNKFVNIPVADKYAYIWTIGNIDITLGICLVRNENGKIIFHMKPYKDNSEYI